MADNYTSGADCLPESWPVNVKKECFTLMRIVLDSGSIEHEEDSIDCFMDAWKKTLSEEEYAIVERYKDAVKQVLSDALYDVTPFACTCEPAPENPKDVVVEFGDDISYSIYTLAPLIKAVCKHYEIYYPRHYRCSLSEAYTCSKLRTGEFGGTTIYVDGHGCFDTPTETYVPDSPSCCEVNGVIGIPAMLPALVEGYIVEFIDKLWDISHGCRMSLQKHNPLRPLLRKIRKAGDTHFPVFHTIPVRNDEKAAHSRLISYKYYVGEGRCISVPYTLMELMKIVETHHPELTILKMVPIEIAHTEHYIGRFHPDEAGLPNALTANGTSYYHLYGGNMQGLSDWTELWSWNHNREGMLVR